MSNAVTLYSVNDMQTMAKVMASTGFFGFKRPEEALALMLIAQAEGRHPATIAQDYDVIQGRPALKSIAALARFQIAGGSVQWIESNDLRAVGEFSHPAGGTLRVTWDMERAKTAGLAGKDNWKKFGAQMLRARCAAEGVRAVFPACLNGMYVSEEVQDFEPRGVAKAPAQPLAPIPTDSVELADQKRVEALMARLAELDAPDDAIAEVMGATRCDEMTADQFGKLAALWKALDAEAKAKAAAPTTTTEEEEPQE